MAEHSTELVYVSALILRQRFRDLRIIERAETGELSLVIHKSSVAPASSQQVPGTLTSYLPPGTNADRDLSPLPPARWLTGSEWFARSEMAPGRQSDPCYLGSLSEPQPLISPHTSRCVQSTLPQTGGTFYL